MTINFKTQKKNDIHISDGNLLLWKQNFTSEPQIMLQKMFTECLSPTPAFFCTPVKLLSVFVVLKIFYLKHKKLTNNLRIFNFLMKVWWALASPLDICDGKVNFFLPLDINSKERNNRLALKVTLQRLQKGDKGKIFNLLLVWPVWS